VQVYPHPGRLRDQLNPEQNNPTLDPNAANLGVVAAQCCLSLKYVVAVRVRLMKLG
jgi:hypothetical protein